MSDKFDMIDDSDPYTQSFMKAFENNEELYKIFGDVFDYDDDEDDDWDDWDW